VLLLNSEFLPLSAQGRSLISVSCYFVCASAIKAPSFGASKVARFSLRGIRVIFVVFRSDSCPRCTSNEPLIDAASS
jgi:hypothetical protein